ncbi:MAG: M20/M25/M40 family metallo-hydrolase, partial [Anaerolineae bacterium]|nr:M20/M25/M40 family metallo-hydrolase [Anaerolineae bacterium]
NHQTTELIKRLSLAIGVTGYSGPNNIHDLIAAEFVPLTDQVERDRIGSVVGLKSGMGKPGKPKRKIMLAAHLDEIGGIVTAIDDNVLRFSQVGWLDARVLMGQEVMVHGWRDLPGVIGSIPPHFLPPGERTDRVDLAKMHIDVGLSPAQLKKLVQVGDLISFRQEPVVLQNSLISGKSLDNRVSLAAVVICLQELVKRRHVWDVYAVATADEEWGRYVGATTQAYAVQPDVALVIDVTFADVDEFDVKLGKGPVLALGPSNNAVIRQRLADICQKLDWPYQSETVASGAGTDAFAIEVSREGVPTLLVSIPSRNMHSPVEIVDPKDVDRTGRLLAEFIAGLDETFVESLIPVRSD